MLEYWTLINANTFQTPVEIQVLLEDGEERFTEDQINQLLDLVQTELMGVSSQQSTNNVTSDSQ